MTKLCAQCQTVAILNDYYNQVYCSKSCKAAAARDREKRRYWAERTVAPKLPPKGIAKLRTCLGGCGRLFPSDHAGNRVCDSCGVRISHCVPVQGCWA